MDRTPSNLRISSFRCRKVVWMLLIVFCWSFLPSVSFAQEPTAMISALTGTVLVNGQTVGEGTILSTGDMLETQAGASVVLELSDGSTLELGEDTKLDITLLAQTTTGARTSEVKMWWGRVRAKLSPDHQQAGSSFNIETPNALVGVKFSQPDVEVTYNQDKEETRAFAYTVALWVTNLLTGESKVVPVGSTVIITATAINVIAGIVGADATIPESTGTATTGTIAGMSKTTVIAIGAGAAAAVGGIAVMAGGGGNGGSGDGNVIVGPVGVWNVNRTWSSAKMFEGIQCPTASGAATFDIRAGGVWYFSDYNRSMLPGWWRVSGSQSQTGSQIQLGDEEGEVIWEGVFTSSNTIRGTMRGLLYGMTGTWTGTRKN